MNWKRVSKLFFKQQVAAWYRHKFGESNKNSNSNKKTTKKTEKYKKNKQTQVRSNH